MRNMPPILSLAGRTAIITGASRGIGLAIAQSFAMHGAKNLILVGREAARLQEAKMSISTVNSTYIDIMALDVQNQSAWKFVKQAVSGASVQVNLPRRS